MSFGTAALTQFPSRNGQLPYVLVVDAEGRLFQSRMSALQKDESELIQARRNVVTIRDVVHHAFSRKHSLDVVQRAHSCKVRIISSQIANDCAPKASMRACSNRFRSGSLNDATDVCLSRVTHIRMRYMSSSASRVSPMSCHLLS